MFFNTNCGTRVSRDSRFAEQVDFLMKGVICIFVLPFILSTSWYSVTLRVRSICDIELGAD